jgi:hypothetical protein
MSSRAARKRLRRKAEPQPFIRIDGETVATMGDVSITFRGGTFVDASGQTFSQDAEGRVYLVGARPIAGEYTVAEIARRSAYGWTEAPIGIVTDVSPEDPTRVGVQLNGATFFDEAHPYTPPVPGSFSNWLPDTGQRLPVAPTLCRIHDECRRGAEEGPRNHGLDVGEDHAAWRTARAMSHACWLSSGYLAGDVRSMRERAHSTIRPGELAEENYHANGRFARRTHRDEALARSKARYAPKNSIVIMAGRRSGKLLAQEAWLDVRRQQAREG